MRNWSLSGAGLRLFPALSLSLFLIGAQPALAVGKVGQITADGQNNLIFSLRGDESPASPKFVKVGSGENRLAIQFPEVMLDLNTLPSVEDLNADLVGRLPGFKSLKYSAVPSPDGRPTTTGMVIIEFEEGTRVSPTVATLNQSVIAVNLGLGGAGATRAAAPAATNASADAAGSTGSGAGSKNDLQNAYEQYYKAFMNQKIQSTAESAEWKPRVESVNNAGALKPKAIVTDTALDINKEVGANELKKVAELASKDVAAPKAAPGAAPADSSAIESTNELKLDIKPIPVSSSVTAESSASGAIGASSATSVSGAAVGDAGKGIAAIAMSPNAVATPRPVAAAKPKAAAVAVTNTAGAAGAAGATANENPKLKARKIFNQAVSDHLHGRLDKAIEGYKAALAIDDELGTAYSNLGLAYNQKNNYASAKIQFHKALAINPRDAITYNGLGAACKAENDLANAIKNFESAVKNDPKLSVAHYNLGTAYEAAGDFDRAVSSYEAALRNDSRLGEAHYRIGLIMQKRKRVEDAKEQYQKALKADENADYATDAKKRLAALAAGGPAK